MSMFVSSKWQRVALPTGWRASVRPLFYCYLTFLDHKTNISRKVCAPRRVSASGAPNKFQNCHLDDKTNMDKTSQHHIFSRTDEVWILFLFLLVPVGRYVPAPLTRHSAVGTVPKRIFQRKNKGTKPYRVSGYKVATGYRQGCGSGPFSAGSGSCKSEF